MSHHFDLAVIGGGLAGSSAALAAAAAGWSVAFVAPAASTSDHRTTALLSESIAFLDRLGVWHDVAPQAAALSTMRILDGTRRLFRAPPVTFRSSEIGLSEFGYNIPNQPLLAALAAKVADTPSITRFRSPLADARTVETAVDLTLADGSTIAASALMAADGRKSVARDAAGIKVRTWSYPQSALVMNFSHRLDHQNTSTEFHTEAGPFTQVPLPGRRSSLVWAMDPGEIDGVQALPRTDLNARVEARMASILGAVEVEDGFQSFPMSSLIAHRFGAGRTLLVGEAGHAFPPIGAQGLNLGLRDIEQAIAALAEAGGPANAETAARRYDSQRRVDVSSRTFGVDLLNRALLTSFLPAQLLRAGGLAALDSIRPLKLLAMREGMTPGWRGAARSGE